MQCRTRPYKNSRPRGIRCEAVQGSQCCPSCGEAGRGFGNLPLDSCSDSHRTFTEEILVISSQNMHFVAVQGIRGHEESDAGRTGVTMLPIVRRVWARVWKFVPRLSYSLAPHRIELLQRVSQLRLTPINKYWTFVSRV